MHQLKITRLSLPVLRCQIRKLRAELTCGIVNILQGCRVQSMTTCATTEKSHTRNAFSTEKEMRIRSPSLIHKTFNSMVRHKSSTWIESDVLKWKLGIRIAKHAKQTHKCFRKVMGQVPLALPILLKQSAIPIRLTTFRPRNTNGSKAKREILKVSIR